MIDCDFEYLCLFLTFLHTFSSTDNESFYTLEVGVANLLLHNYFNMAHDVGERAKIAA